MRKLMLVVIVLGLSCVALGGAGCGNVYLAGDALTAAECSAANAYGAAQRATAPGAVPYLTENYVQWRYFVRAARKDATWGPTLPAESAGAREGE